MLRKFVFAWLRRHGLVAVDGIALSALQVRVDNIEWIFERSGAIADAWCRRPKGVRRVDRMLALAQDASSRCAPIDA